MATKLQSLVKLLQGPILHLVVLSPESPLFPNLQQFLSLSLSFMTLTLLKSTGQLVCKDYAFRAKWRCAFLRGCVLSVHFGSDDGNLDRMVTVVFASLHYKVIIFSFVFNHQFMGRYTVRLCSYPVSHQILFLTKFSAHQWFLPMTIISVVFAKWWFVISIISFFYIY